MRVTSNSFPNVLVSQLGDLANREARLQTQAATGQRIQLPEDDPKAVRRVLDMQTSIRAANQYQKNIERQKEIAGASFNVMKGMKKLSDRAGEIATLADGLKSREQLTIYGNEINEMIKQGVQAANATFRGDYLLSGTASGTPPFTSTKDASGNITSVDYKGNSSLPESEIAENVVTSAHTVGGNSAGSGPRGLITDSQSGADFFKHLIDLRDHLLAGDTASVNAADIHALKNDENNFVYHYGLNGATQARLEATGVLARSQSASLSLQVSTEVDADLAQTLTLLNQVQNSYKAALQTGGTIMQVSLLDYLR